MCDSCEVVVYVVVVHSRLSTWSLLLLLFTSVAGCGCLAS